MPYSEPQQSRGFSLLELLLVLIVIAGILFLGFNRYQLYQQQRNVAAIKENIDLLLQATTVYTHINCRATDNPFTVTVDDLKKAGLFPKLTDVSIASNYTVKADLIQITTTTRKPVYALSASVTLSVPSALLPWYLQRLNASLVQGPGLTWTRLPSYSIDSTESGLWIARTGLHQFKEAATTQSQQNPDNSCAY